MVPSAAGAVVVVSFPFTDLSSHRMRPSVVLAHADRGDWILCQITSKVYSDPRAVSLSDNDFDRGSLNMISYVRPGKLFTANQTLIVAEVGFLRIAAMDRAVQAVVDILKPNHPGR